jgi:uncharacterized membrane protein
VRALQTVTLLTATIITGLVAGLMFAYACSVMPGLALSSDHTFVETMQNIDAAILNPWFLLPFVVSIPLIALAAVLAWRGHGRPALPWIIAALVIYVVAYAITTAVNVPLNNELVAAGDPDRIADLGAVRERFEDPWVMWNIVRTVAHTIAFGLLAWALVGYRAHGGRSGAASPPAAHHSSAA